MNELQKIPKLLHWNWFGKRMPPPIVNVCRDSWVRHLPDWTIIEWNLENIDIPSNPYTDKCIEQERWAFLSDYVQCSVISKYGGVYVDSDVELLSSLDPFLSFRAFGGFETSDFPFTALWGAELNHPWPQSALRYLDSLTSEDLKTVHGNRTNTSWMSQLLCENFGVNRSQDRFQLVKEGIAVFPSSTFCVDIGNGIAKHHFSGSWVNQRDEPSRPQQILATRLENNFSMGLAWRPAIVAEILTLESRVKRHPLKKRVRAMLQIVGRCMLLMVGKHPGT